MTSEDTLAVVRRVIRERTEERLVAMRERADDAHTEIAALKVAILAATRFRAVIVELPQLAVGANEIDVTWDVPIAAADYGVTPTLEAGPVVLGKVTAGLKAGTRTAEGCVVVVTNAAAVAIPAGVQLHVLGWRNGGS